MTDAVLHFSKPISDDVKSALSQINSFTSSIDVYQFLADLVISDDDSKPILGDLRQRTGMELADLRFAWNEIRRGTAFTADSEDVALALDVRARRLGHGLTLRRTSDRRLWRYAGTHWRVVNPSDLRPEVMDFALSNHARYGGPGSVGSAIKVICDLAPLDDELLRRPTEVVNVMDQEIWLTPTGEFDLRPHRPESRLHRTFPVRYDQHATCPHFDAMLAGIFASAPEPDEMVRHVTELLGYAIQPRRNLPTVLLLWGGGANGKSTLLEIVQALVGAQQVYSGTLAHLSADRFILPNLENKLLFVEDDSASTGRLDDGILKKICENKRIDTRRAGSRSGVTFYSTLLPIIAGNNVPEILDTSDGMRRRLQVVPFDRHFGPDERDEGLVQRIITTELPGVLNRLLEELARLRARGDFAPPQHCLDAREAFLVAANPLLAFLDEACVKEQEARVSIRELYRAFCDWMRRQRRTPPFGEQQLSPRLRGLGFRVHKSNTVQVQGLRLH